ncbi:hypothetical protein OG559_22740 [Micromonospora sp. NBC_01405]|uniref:hypothetical protein n=1 Tax=Micromonospora sp. NBC_01405 TaxID=2903589 RepID=UPI00324309C8
MALPATVGPGGVVSAWPNRPGWARLDVRRAFGELFGGVPMGWAADGDPAALAEANAAGGGRILYLGVGAGVVVDAAEGAPTLRGPFEIGHVITDPGGPRSAQAVALRSRDRAGVRGRRW